MYLKRIKHIKFHIEVVHLLCIHLTFEYSIKLNANQNQMRAKADLQIEEYLKAIHFVCRDI